MATQPKPTLHEIAAMSFPASQEAMRKHYDAKWHTDATQDGEAPRKFRVKADWTISGTMNEVIEAESEEEARELAEEYALDEAYRGHVDVDILSIEEVEE